MEALLQFTGRLHVMMLHAPIGLLIGLGALELFMLVRHRTIPREVRGLLAWLVALAAVASVGTGLLLSLEGGHDADTMDLHQWLGIACGAGALLAAVLQQCGKRLAYGLVLGITCGLVIPTGHLGASMTHGDNFLTEPFSPSHVRNTPGTIRSQQSNGGPLTVYAATIAPIFQSSCVGCHGPDRQKGDLRLDSPEGILAGGRNGPAIVPGDPDGSDLLWRMTVDIDDDDHMPPKKRPQPREAEIKAIREWIAQGASFTTLASVPAATDHRAGEVRSAERGEGEASPPTALQGARNLPPPPAASAASLDVIRGKLVHVEPVSRDSTLLVIDASAVAKTVDDSAARLLLEPVLEQTSDLTLARTKITDATASLLSRMPRLKRLNISSTGVSDAGIALLASHPALEELIVSGCGLTDRAIESIGAMPSLRRVYVWKTGITPEAVASLRAKRAGLAVDAGDAAASVALEKDDPAQPGGAAAQADPTHEAALIAAAKAEALHPVNTVCPVSGKAVDAGFAIVYKGRVIGFCCRHCLGQFLEEPAKFEANVK